MSGGSSIGRAVLEPMAEWSIAADSKSVSLGRHRGFESLWVRHFIFDFALDANLLKKRLVSSWNV